jgi:hypothetical protein
MMDHCFIACALGLIIGCSAPAPRPVAPPSAIGTGEGVGTIDDSKPEKRCHLIGCEDGFGVVIDGPSDKGVPIDDRTHLFGAIDGVSFDCTAMPDHTEGDECPDARKLKCGGALVFINQVMHGNARASCDERLLRRLDVPGTPRVVHVVIETVGRAPIDRTFSPSYTTLQPNGPACEPTCSVAGENVVVQ